MKPLGAFGRNRSQASGYCSYCKPCHNRITRRDKEKHGGARNYHLRRRYGITAEHYDRMFEEQGGLCAICREAPAAHVDHDHASGRVRGLLCFNCNGALGQFRDRTDLMLQAIVYLEREAFPEGVPPPLRPVLSLILDSDEDFDDDGPEPPPGGDGDADWHGMPDDGPDDGVAAAG